MCLNTIDEIKRPIALEFAQFEQAFRDALKTDHPLLKEALEHIILTVGKQLRPIIAAVGQNVPWRKRKNHPNGGSNGVAPYGFAHTR